MDPFLGQIVSFAGNFAPRGWAYCDGQLLAISQYSALFSILGTTYGGDGRSTFALPDLRGRAPVAPGRGPGLSTRTLGQRGGQEEHTLIIPEMPSHSHISTGTVTASTSEGTTNVPTGNVLAAGKTPIDRSTVVDTNMYTNVGPNTQMAANEVTVTVGNNGGNLPHNNMQPYLAINFIIALQGVFPSRN